MPVISTERYEIDPQPLGRGGFGEAYAARDLLFDRDVVIKTILSSRLYGIDEPSFRHQFFREALVSAKLGHETQYIVKVLDYGYDRHTDQPFFVMEKVEGGDLSARVGNLSMADAVSVMSDVLQGLAVAHKHGVIHSDISPDNILFDAKAHAFKLNDFGLAKLLTSVLMSRGTSLSLTGGKPGYLPIDQWHTGDRNEFSDLYGLAVTIIELLSGKVPFWGFDFELGRMECPNLADQIAHTEDSVVIAQMYDNKGQYPFGVKAESAGFDSWSQQHGWGQQYCTFVTQGDFMDLLTSIINRELTDTVSVFSYMEARTLNHVLPRERAYREEIALRRRERDAARGADQKVSSKHVERMDNDAGGPDGSHESNNATHESRENGDTVAEG